MGEVTAGEMRALIVDDPGPNATIGFGQTRCPELGADDVRVRVELSSVNFADVLTMRGNYPYQRRDVVIPGIEAVGTVDAVGERVDRIAVGQRVVALLGSAGWAEYAVAPSARVRHLPEGADIGERVAAGVVTTATSVLTASQARLGQGESVLVPGAAGGLGTVLAQVMKARGARVVYGTARTADRAAHARSFGYDDVFFGEDFPAGVLTATGGLGVDLVIDGVGGPTRERCYEILAPFGRLIAVGNSSQVAEGVPDGDVMRAKNFGVAGASLGSLMRDDPQRAGGFMDDALGLIASDAFRVDISAVVSAENADEAVRSLAAREVVGKILLRFNA